MLYLELVYYYVRRRKNYVTMIMSQSDWRTGLTDIYETI